MSGSFKQPCHTADMSTAIGGDYSRINLLDWTVGTIWKVPIRCVHILKPAVQEQPDWTKSQVWDLI